MECSSIYFHLLAVRCFICIVYVRSLFLPHWKVTGMFSAVNVTFIYYVWCHVIFYVCMVYNIMDLIIFCISQFYRMLYVCVCVLFVLFCFVLFFVVYYYYSYLWCDQAIISLKLLYSTWLCALFQKLHFAEKKQTLNGHLVPKIWAIEGL